MIRRLRTFCDALFRLREEEMSQPLIPEGSQPLIPERSQPSFPSCQSSLLSIYDNDGFLPPLPSAEKSPDDLSLVPAAELEAHFNILIDVLEEAANFTIYKNPKVALRLAHSVSEPCWCFEGLLPRQTELFPSFSIVDLVNEMCDKVVADEKKLEDKKKKKKRGGLKKGEMSSEEDIYNFVCFQFTPSRFGTL